MPDRSKEPEIRSFGRFTFDEPEVVNLKNGIKVNVISGDIWQPLCRLDVIMRGGCYEEADVMVSNATSQLLNAETVSASKNELAEILDYNGATMTAVPHSHYAQISIVSLTDRLAHVLPVFFDMVTSPAFPENELEIYRREQYAQIGAKRMRVDYCSSRCLARNTYGKAHPLAIDALISDVKRLTTDALKQFHAQYYTPGNCEIVLSGKITEKEIALVDKYFGEWSTANAGCELVQKEAVPMKSRVSVRKLANGLQNGISISIPSINRRHDDYIAMRILITALGGYFGSRLNANIREEKGYTYGITASMISDESRGAVLISTQCASDATIPLLEEVAKEIKRLKEEPIPYEELCVVREHMLSNLAESQKSPFAKASQLTSKMLCDIPDWYFNRHVEELCDITSERLAEVAKKYLDMNIARMGIAGDVPKYIKREFLRIFR